MIRPSCIWLFAILFLAPVARAEFCHDISHDFGPWLPSADTTRGTLPGPYQDMPDESCAQPDYGPSAGDETSLMEIVNPLAEAVLPLATIECTLRDGHPFVLHLERAVVGPGTSSIHESLMSPVDAIWEDQDVDHCTVLLTAKGQASGVYYNLMARERFNIVYTLSDDDPNSTMFERLTVTP